MTAKGGIALVLAYRPGKTRSFKSLWARSISRRFGLACRGHSYSWVRCADRRVTLNHPGERCSGSMTRGRFAAKMISAG